MSPEYGLGDKLFGNLHDYLKQRRKLKEGLAASIFRQIVLLVRDARIPLCTERGAQDAPIVSYLWHPTMPKRCKLGMYSCSDYCH